MEGILSPGSNSWNALLELLEMNYKTVWFPGAGKISCVNRREAFRIYHGIFIKRGYKFSVSTKSPVILDCGAHIGLSVIYFKKIYPNSKIIAFEPDPLNFKLLKLNTSRLSNVRLVNAALWGSEGVSDFHITGEKQSPWSWGNALVINKWQSDGFWKTIKVRTVKLSNYMKGVIDFIKMDIEGSETEVLKEIKQKLNLVYSISIEFHGSTTNRNNSVEEIVRILGKGGFKYEIEQGAGLVRLDEIDKKDPYLLMIYASKKRNSGFK